MYTFSKNEFFFVSDSVIYVTRPGDIYHPKMGSFLGEMTDELEEYGEGASITEFISGGPKNYGFRGQAHPREEVHHGQDPGVHSQLPRLHQAQLQHSEEEGKLYYILHFAILYM